MWKIGEVASGENGGPCYVIPVGQCVEQFEGILEKTAFAVRIDESFGEGMVLVETGFYELCVEFLRQEWALTCREA